MAKELQKNQNETSGQIQHFKGSSIRVKAIADVLKDVSPSIGSLARTEGEKDAVDALYILITALVNFFNVGKTMGESQIDQTAELILDCYPMYKLSDIQLCFNRAKAGRYGKIYDRIDGQVILEWVGMYEQEREEEIIELRRKESQQAKEDAKDISWLANENIKVDFRDIGKEKQPEKPKTKLDIKIQKWIAQFDKLEKKQVISKSASFAHRGNKIMDVNEWLNYKLNQEQKVINYLKNR